MVNDPVADMVTRIKNAGMSGSELAIVPYSNLKFEIANVLLKKGFIKGFSVKGKKINKRIEVEILYDKNKRPRIENVKRVSKPSRRIYIGAKDIIPVNQGRGIAVLSTPGGVLVGDEARKKNVGGEVLFEMW